MLGTSSRIVQGGEPMRTNNGEDYFNVKLHRQMPEMKVLMKVSMK